MHWKSDKSDKYIEVVNNTNRCLGLNTNKHTSALTQYVEFLNTAKVRSLAQVYTCISSSLYCIDVSTNVGDQRGAPILLAISNV